MSQAPRARIARPEFQSTSTPADRDAALDRLTAELARCRAVAVEGLDELRPALATVKGFGDRLDALCRFLRRWGPWFLASAPGVLVAIGAVSPNAAAALKALLSGFGGAP